MKLNLLQNKSNEKGQVLLITLLVISVLLVVGLSVVSRSVTDVKISQQSQESARALWVAQAGLEEAIRSGSNISDTTQNINYTVTRNQLGGSSFFVFPKSLTANEVITVWFVDHDESDGSLSIPLDQLKNITVGWGETESPAVEANLIYENGGNYYNQRYAFDPITRPDATNFSTVSMVNCSIGGKVFSYCANIDFSALTGTPYFMRVKLLFNNDVQPIGFLSADPNENFPLQGYCYDATAKVNESSVQRRLEDCRLWPTTPEIFDYLLFSGTSIP